MGSSLQRSSRELRLRRCNDSVVEPNIMFLKIVFL